MKLLPIALIFAFFSAVALSAQPTPTTSDLWTSNCLALVVWKSNPELMTAESAAYFDGMLRGASANANIKTITDNYLNVCLADPTKSVSAALVETVAQSQ